MNTIMQKGFAAPMQYSEEDACFIDRVAGITDVIGFHGQGVDELRTAFIEAVDDYLETCQKLGQKPKHPYSGQFRLRLPPGLHVPAAFLHKRKEKV